jgi:hypothetical protein
MLMAQLTSFMGRQRELAELERLIANPQESCRLATLVGPRRGRQKPPRPRAEIWTIPTETTWWSFVSTT